MSNTENQHVDLTQTNDQWFRVEEGYAERIVSWHKQYI